MTKQNEAAAATETKIESAPDITKVDVSKCTTKSSKIRTYAAAGFSTGQIAKHMGIRFQHVRNVLVTPVTNPKL